jgi:hypothetical protein
MTSMKHWGIITFFAIESAFASVAAVAARQGAGVSFTTGGTYFGTGFRDHAFELAYAADSSGYTQPVQWSSIGWRMVNAASLEHDTWWSDFGYEHRWVAFTAPANPYKTGGYFRVGVLHAPEWLVVLIVTLCPLCLLQRLIWRQRAIERGPGFTLEKRSDESASG